MKYIVYADRLFVRLFFQNWILLYLVCSLLRSPQGSPRPSSKLGALCRLVPAAALQAFLFCFVFLLPGPAGWMKKTAIFTGSLMILFRVLNIRSIGLLVRTVLMYGFCAFLLGGILYALPVMGIMEKISPLPTEGIMAAAAAFILFFRERRQRRANCPAAKVVLVQGDVRVEADALIDSGNSLRDPVSGRPVSVAQRSFLEGQLALPPPIWEAVGTGEKPVEGFRLVPYHTLNGRGLMQVMEIDRITVKRDGEERLIQGALLGLCEGLLSEKGSCQIILHPALFLTGGSAHDIKGGSTGKNAVSFDPEGAGLSVFRAGRHSLHRRRRGTSAAPRGRQGERDHIRSGNGV